MPKPQAWRTVALADERGAGVGIYEGLRSGVIEHLDRRRVHAAVKRMPHRSRPPLLLSKLSRLAIRIYLLGLFSRPGLILS